MKCTLGLNMYGNNYCMINPIGINEKETRKIISDGKYHIYLICKRKKYFIDNYNHDEKGNLLITYYYLDNEHNKKYVYYINEDITILAHNREEQTLDIVFKDKKHTINEFLLLNNFCYSGTDLIGDKSPEYLPSDLEVMYIGQAFGRKGNRTIDFRLVHHEKIQKIAVGITNSGLNEELFVIGVTVKENDLSFFAGITGQSPGESSLSKLKSIKKSAALRPSEGQKITLFEASLIRYFQPSCNIEHKMSFPNPDFSSYDEIYSMNFDFISFAIDTGTTASVRLFSERMPKRRYHHFGEYMLKQQGNGNSLFDSILHDIEMGKNSS